MNHTRQALMERYQFVVTELLGWPCETDEGGAVRFLVDDWAFILDNHAPDDPEYFRLHTGFELGEEVLGLSLDSVAVEATRRTRGAKVFVHDGFVVCSVEFLAAAPDCMPLPQHLAGVLPRATRMALQGLSTFVTGMKLAGIEAATRLAMVE